MVWRSGLAVLVLGLAVVGACNGRLLPGGFPSSTEGSGGSANQGNVVVTPPAGTGGATGGSGAGGSGTGGSGAGGSADDGGAASCDELVALYVAGVEQDKACDPNSTQPQCQLHVIPSLCVGCRGTAYVNSTAASSAARLRWDKASCPVTTCPLECSPPASGARCAPTSDGGGHCVDIVL
jgi:hypothetical protein